MLASTHARSSTVVGLVAQAASPSAAAASASSCCWPTFSSAETRACCRAVATQGFVTDQNGTELTEECQTGQDANERQDCRIVGFVNSIQDYWTDAFAQSGSTYEPADTVLYDGGVNTACGAASSAVGPFYCPLDTHVYLDLGFYDELRHASARGRPAGRGIRRRARVRPPHPEPIGNLAGAARATWAPRVRRSVSSCRPTASPACGPQRRRHRVPGQLTVGHGTALDAASAVGDDRIQERVQGHVTPESWTHGSEQRQQWFVTGYEGGRVDDCDTFDAPTSERDRWLARRRHARRQIRLVRNRHAHRSDAHGPARGG